MHQSLTSQASLGIDDFSRTDDPSDRRARVLSLSANGRKFLAVPARIARKFRFIQPRARAARRATRPLGITPLAA
jgi:hypothetical protein